MEFARQHKLFFKEASAVTNYNVKHCFEHLLQEVYNQAAKTASANEKSERGLKIQRSEEHTSELQSP